MFENLIKTTKMAKVRGVLAVRGEGREPVGYALSIGSRILQLYAEEAAVARFGTI
jgi:hypothetical protein